MDGDAIAELSERLLGPVEVGDYIFKPDGWTAHDPAELVRTGPKPTPLSVATLGAVRDYLTANKDALPLESLVVHVNSPTHVVVLGPLNAHDRSRETYLVANCPDLMENWLARFGTLEDFVIALQVRFAETKVRATLLRLLGNVKDESVRTAVDDGVTQVVHARTGVALVTDAAVPNPVPLSPYRTFREVGQPEALFVVRVKGDDEDEGLPLVALFEADGGAWRLQAVESIRAWLRQELPAAVAVLA